MSSAFFDREPTAMTPNTEPRHSPTANRPLHPAQLVAGLLVLAAFGLYVYRLDWQSLWYDEVISAQFALNLDSLPPELAWIKGRARQWAYRYALRLWALLIPNVFGLRWPSVMAGIMAVAMMYRVGTSLAGRRAGLLAALFLLAWPPQVYFAQEVRQYELVVLGSLLSLWTMLLVERGATRWAPWAYAVSVIWTTALHALAALWLATLSVWVALHNRLRTGRIRLVWPLAGLGMVAVVAAVAAFHKGPMVPWIREPALWRFVALYFDFPPPLSDGLRLLLAAAMLALMGLALWQFWKQPATRTRPYSGSAVTTLLFMLAFGPPLAAFVLSYLWTPIWFWRYFLPPKVCFLVLLALATASLRRRWVAVALAAIVLTSSLASSVLLIFDPDFQRTNWRDVAAYVVANQYPGDSVLVPEARLQDCLEYYLPDERIGIDSFSDVEAESEITLRTALEANGRVWVVVEEEAREDVVTWMGQVVPEAAQLDHVDFGTLDLYLLALPPE